MVSSSASWAAGVAKQAQSNVGMAMEVTPEREIPSRSFDEGDVGFYLAVENIMTNLREKIGDGPRLDYVGEPPIDPDLIKPLMQVWIEEPRKEVPPSLRGGGSTRSTSNADAERLIVSCVVKAKVRVELEIEALDQRSYVKEFDTIVVRTLSPRGYDRTLPAKRIIGCEPVSDEQLLTHPSPEIRTLGKAKLNYDSVGILKGLVTDGTYKTLDHTFIKAVLTGLEFNFNNSEKQKGLIEAARKLSGDDMNKFIEVVAELVKLV